MAGFHNDVKTITDVQGDVFTSGDALGTAVLIRNTGAFTAYLGPTGVTSGGATRGLPLEAGELIALSGIKVADDLMGICSAGETTTLVLLYKDP